MAVKSKRLRFEVLKRDGFMCHYCGRRAPEVVLHVDHIVPESEGGEDTLENLVTACEECNLGKSNKRLDSPLPASPAITQRIAEIAAREEQLRNYGEVQRAARQRVDAEVDEVLAFWAERFGGHPQQCYRPYRTHVRGFVEKQGLIEAMDAVNITSEKFPWVSVDAVQYFGGVLRRKLAIAENRLVKCLYCHDFVTLEPGQDPSRAWVHSRCADEREAALEAQRAAEEDLHDLAARVEIAHERALFENELWEKRQMGERVIEQCRLSDDGPTDIDIEVAAWDRLAEADGF